MSSATQLIKGCVSGVFTLCLVTNGALVRASHEDIPYDNVIAARAHVETVKAHVNDLINKIEHPEGGGSEGGCEDHGPSFGHGPRVFTVADDVQENDRLALMALQIMGRELFQLGETVDAAAAAYGTGSFPGYVAQACRKTSKLIKANKGAKVSAGLPIPGMVTPSDFNENEVELQEVKAQLFCP